MSRRILACCLLPFIGNVALADTYLCTAEYAAGVTEKNDEVTRAQSGEYDKKYIADEQGFRPLANDEVLLSECNFVDGRPVKCEYPGDGWGGLFLMSSNRVFTYFSVVAGQSGDLEALVVKGKCSKT